MRCLIVGRLMVWQCMNTGRACKLQVQCSIGHSDYVRRDVALEALIQPLAGEYGMHNSKPQGECPCALALWLLLARMLASCVACKASVCTKQPSAALPRPHLLSRRLSGQLCLLLPSYNRFSFVLLFHNRGDPPAAVLGLVLGADGAAIADPHGGGRGAGRWPEAVWGDDARHHGRRRPHHRPHRTGKPNCRRTRKQCSASC